MTSIAEELLRLKARAAIEKLRAEWRERHPHPEEWKPPHPMAIYQAFSTCGDPDGMRAYKRSR